MNHVHPLNDKAVARAQAAVLAQDRAERVSGRLGLLCEPTRLRTLQALHEAGELCVGDLAITLGVSDDAASYAVRQLRTGGIVEARREGRVVFYALSERFPRALLTECLQLGDPSAEPPGGMDAGGRHAS